MASSFKVTYLPLAIDSLDDIRDYVLLKSQDLDTADRVFARLVGFVDNLAFNPFIGRILSEYDLKWNDVRRITAEKHYNIYYRVDEPGQEMYIIKIVDGRRPIEQQLHGL